MQTDVGDESQVKDLFDKILAEFKRLDILVNNAGKKSFALIYMVHFCAQN